MPNKIFYNVSVTLFGILTLTFLISSVLLNLHIPVNIFNIVVPCFIGIYYLFKNSGTKKEFIIQCIALLFIIIISYCIALFFWDDTWDGRSYHTAMIILLKNSWLPLYDNLSLITEKLSLFPYNTQFSYIYVKFTEIVGANIYNLTGHIESPKTSNLIFLCSLFGYSFFIIKNILKKNIISILLTICICLNPVCISQVLSNYVDLQSYIAFAFLILTILKIEKSDVLTKTDFFILVLSSLMLVTVKLTGVVYCPLIYSVWIIYRFIRKEEVKMVTISAIVALLSVLITCINPFYTNWKTYNHPFYPMMGPYGFDVEHANYPRKFKNKTPLQRFLISTFAESMNSIEGDEYCDINEDYIIKIPFSKISYTYLNKFDNPDMRVGGFGYYWSGILCLTILLMFFLRFKSKEDKKLFLFLILTIALTVAANQYNWWARFVPQLWLIPVITLIFVLSDNNKFPKITKFLSYMVIFFIFLNSILIMKDQLLIKYNFSENYKAHLNFIEQHSKQKGIYFMKNTNFNSNLADEVVKPHLNERNIKIIEIDFDEDKILNENFECLQIFPINGQYYFYKPVE